MLLESWPSCFHSVSSVDSCYHNFFVALSSSVLHFSFKLPVAHLRQVLISIIFQAFHASNVLLSRVVPSVSFFHVYIPASFFPPPHSILAILCYTPASFFLVPHSILPIPKATSQLRIFQCHISVFLPPVSHSRLVISRGLSRPSYHHSHIPVPFFSVPYSILPTTSAISHFRIFQCQIPVFLPSVTHFSFVLSSATFQSSYRQRYIPASCFPESYSSFIVNSISQLPSFQCYIPSFLSPAPHATFVPNSITFPFLIVCGPFHLPSHPSHSRPLCHTSLPYFRGK